MIEEGDESAYWLEILEASGIFPGSKTRELRREAEVLTAIFVSIREKHR